LKELQEAGDRLAECQLLIQQDDDETAAQAAQLLDMVQRNLAAIGKAETLNAKLDKTM